MYKNIAKKEKLELKSLVDYQEGQVVSKTLVQNDYVSVTIFSFDKGEEISRIRWRRYGYSIGRNRKIYNWRRCFHS